jgi:hypothetical protein
MERLKRNRQRYMAIKRQKAEEVVMLLDLFDGKMSIGDLLTLDISLINQLRDAKLRLTDELRKKNSNSKIISSTLTDPQTIKKYNRKGKKK